MPTLPSFHLLHLAGQRADNLFADQGSPLVSLMAAILHKVRVAVTSGRPNAPGSSKTVGELGAPPVVPSNPNSRLGRSSRSSIRQGRVAMDSIVVGIDVAKDRLDVALRPSGEVFVVERNAGGLELLVQRLKPLAPSLVVLEATGGFETVGLRPWLPQGCRSSSLIRPRSAPSPRRSASVQRQMPSTQPSSPTSPRQPSPSRGRWPMKPRVSLQTWLRAGGRSSR